MASSHSSVARLCVHHSQGRLADSHSTRRNVGRDGLLISEGDSEGHLRRPSDLKNRRSITRGLKKTLKFVALIAKWATVGDTTSETMPCKMTRGSPLLLRAAPDSPHRPPCRRKCGSDRFSTRPLFPPSLERATRVLTSELLSSQSAWPTLLGILRTCATRLRSRSARRRRGTGT